MKPPVEVKQPARFVPVFLSIWEEHIEHFHNPYFMTIHLKHPQFLAHKGDFQLIKNRHLDISNLEKSVLVLSELRERRGHLVKYLSVIWLDVKVLWILLDARSKRPAQKHSS